MLKIFVYATNLTLAEQTVQFLKTAGAVHAELLETLNIPARQPKEHRYIFICETPAEKLSALAPKVLPEADYAQELSQWYEAQNHIVTTATTQKKRSIVLTTAQIGDAKGLLTSINEQWGLNLKVQEAEVPRVKNEDPLLAYLVQNLIEQTAPLQALQLQINSLAVIDVEALNETDALIGYRGLVQHQIELQSQNHQLASAQAELNNQLKNLTEDNERLLAQLHAVQEELGQIFLENNKFKEDAANEKSDLTAALDILSKAAAEGQKQVEVLCHEKNDLQTQNQFLQNSNSILDAQFKDTTEENELLLLQLHQVQEELEHYFLKCNDIEKQHSSIQKRWQNLLEQHPDHIAYESVSVKPIDESKTESDQPLLWEIEGLESATVSRPYIRFETFIESGILGVRFHRNDDSKETGTLVRWPSVAKKLNFIECIPAGHGEKKKIRARILRDLSTSDWQLLVLIPKLLTRALNSKIDLCRGSNSVIEAATILEQLLSRLPERLRTDDVILKNHQINSDYEHLWFELNNMCLGKKHWHKFEIRFGASELIPSRVKQHLKIEIPLIDGLRKPFDNWFEESSDDFGPKWELRFDLNERIYDARVWKKLTQVERRLIVKIVNLLLADGITTVREVIQQADWADWSQAFRNCLTLLASESHLDY